MVAVGYVYVLLRHVRRSLYQTKSFHPDKISRGKESVKDLLPYTIVNRKKPRTQKPAPGWKKIYHSIIFQHDLRMRVTLSCQRAIDKAGGFDRYIYYTPEENLRSPLAITLKRRMQALVAKHPSVEPPPLDKRNPKPLPKKLSVEIKPVQVCDMSKYVYLG